MPFADTDQRDPVAYAGLSFDDYREAVELDLGPHGHWTASTTALDRAIARYLPSSPHDLRELVEGRTESDWSNCGQVSTFLVVLADLDSQ